MEHPSLFSELRKRPLAALASLTDRERRISLLDDSCSWPLLSFIASRD